MERSPNPDGQPRVAATQPRVALTIAGSDSGGGAGVQADLKTFAMHGVFGASVFTALTAQNTVEVRGIELVRPDFVAQQLDAVLNDLPVAAVKTGMLGSADNVSLLARRLAERPGDLPNLVVDPVLVSTSGHSLFEPHAASIYLRELFAHATVVTPNLREAEVLLGRTLSSLDDAVAAASELAATGARCVVVKGGHVGPATSGEPAGGEPATSGEPAGGEPAGGSVAGAGPTAEAIDVVWLDGSITLLRAPWIETRNTHGTGCTFAAALTARLALGAPLPQALQAAKRYVHAALEEAAGWRLGTGPGPLSWKVPDGK